MPDASVRPATPRDATAVCALQAAVWSQTYAGLLPVDTLHAAGSAEAVATWERAISTPPSPRHQVLVALAGEQVVGFAALAPATDPDLDPAGDAELHALCVAPDRTGEGHGSRLVNATADVARGRSVARLHVWLCGRETGLRRFLEGAGWAEDGARRRLDLRGDEQVVVDQVRLATSLAGGDVLG